MYAVVPVRNDGQHEVGGALTLAGRWQLDLPLGSCREEPGLLAEQCIQVQTPQHSSGTQTILLRRASSTGATAPPEVKVARSTSLASSRCLIPVETYTFQVSAVNIEGAHLPRPLPLRTNCNASPPRPDAALSTYTPPQCFETPHPRGIAAGDAGGRCV